MKPGMEERGRDRVVRWLRRKLVAGFAGGRSCCAVLVKFQSNLGHVAALGGPAVLTGQIQVQGAVE